MSTHARMSQMILNQSHAMSKLRNWVEKHWYAPSPGALNALLPLEGLYRHLVKKRAQAWRQGGRSPIHPKVPVIVVGNLNVGGSGKSPLVASLVRLLQQAGWQPGIVSRGYGGQAPSYPLRVDAQTPVGHSGDEPLMLALQTGVPVMVDPKRARAALALAEQGCDVIVADDGLQHWPLGRDIELLVLDAQRRAGNEHCLPVGPLREPLSRLQSVDWVIWNQPPSEADQAWLAPLTSVSVSHYQLKPLRWVNGAGEGHANCPFAAGTRVHALAGIGFPARFFAQLEAQGLDVIPHPLADHARMDQNTLNLAGDEPVIMTAKDRVKLLPWLNARHWTLEVEAQLTPEFSSAFLHRLCALRQAS